MMKNARQTFIDYFTSELTNIKDTPIRNSLGKSKFSESDLRKILSNNGVSLSASDIQKYSNLIANAKTNGEVNKLLNDMFVEIKAYPETDEFSNYVKK